MSAHPQRKLTPAQELRMECMFPADDATETRHRQLLDAHAPAR